MEAGVSPAETEHVGIEDRVRGGVRATVVREGCDVEDYGSGRTNRLARASFRQRQVPVVISISNTAPVRESPAADKETGGTLPVNTFHSGGNIDLEAGSAHLQRGGLCQASRACLLC